MKHGKNLRSRNSRQQGNSLRSRVLMRSMVLISIAVLLIALLFVRMAGFVLHTHPFRGASNIREHSAVTGKIIEWPRSWTDSFNDGTPDFLRLESPSDQAAFRQWFIAIANFEAGRPAATLPAEITDCAGLLRYCYREALKRHNDSWFLETGIEPAAIPGEILQWHYPQTPLGANLFRVARGSFQRATLAADFAQFADAKTLVERNSFLIGRDLRQAQPGDLLFFRQFEQSSPWHSMIVVTLGDENGRRSLGVIYHTGPIGHGAHPQPGEIRKVALDELLNHPKAEWRPISTNPNFLGIYRWNILRLEQ